MLRKTNNDRRTLSLKQDKPPSPSYFWLVKFALFILRFACKLIDLFGGGTGDD